MRMNSDRKNNALHDLGPLYHNYSFFGVDNEQLPGIYELNQKAKSPVLLAYIAYAIAKSRESSSDRVSFTELFCADGYYAMAASRLGCDRSVGIDGDGETIAKAGVIAQRLELRGVAFLKQQITPDSVLAPTDIVANVGGLYHVDAPEKILEMSYRMAKKFLIVQTVVSLATDDEEYFEAPAPGWTWGNRFSRKSFDRMLMGLRPNIIDHHFNELEGNSRPEDRGSVYYLIKKP